MINKNKTQIDALIKEARRIRDDAIDHEYDVERDFAANIAHHLSPAQLSKALIECRNAISWDGFYIDDLNRLADEIVKLIDADLQDNLAADIRALTARISDAETIATSTEAETLDEARRYLIAASIVIEDGKPSHATKSKTEPETPIYETLAPGECLVISKSGDSLLVACNNDGETIVKRVVMHLSPLDEMLQLNPVGNDVPASIIDVGLCGGRRIDEP